MIRPSNIARMGLALMLLCCAACGKGEKPAEPSPSPAASPRAARTLPVPQPQDPQQAGITPPPPGSGAGETGMSWKIPAGWIEETPSSAMRRAQYKVPGQAGDGECTVFYFGPGQGGDPMSNAMRWAGQFKQPDGRSPQDALETSTLEVGNIKVLEVEVKGTYAGGMTATMAPAEDKPGYMLLGAVAEGPDSNWFFKLTGPEATVQSQRGAFEGMLRSLKTGA